MQVVRKQFPLGPAAAKTIHRSQSVKENRIVVNFNTRKAIRHIHYVELSRGTTIEGLYITDPCENKILVSNAVLEEMARLRNDGKLSFCVSPVYKADQISFKLCFLNARSLHKHIDDVRKDLNYSSTDVNINFLQRQDMLVLITMIFMLLMGIIYLEMIVHQLVV